MAKLRLRTLGHSATPTAQATRLWHVRGVAVLSHRHACIHGSNNCLVFRAHFRQKKKLFRELKQQIRLRRIAHVPMCVLLVNVAFRE
jgi:hypothetical protein